MERIVLRDIVIEGTHIDKLHVLMDDDKNLIVLPLLWTTHLANIGCIYKWAKQGSFNNTSTWFQNRKPSTVQKTFDANPVTENTIENYIGHFFNFLKYINQLHKSEKTPSVHNTELVNSRFVNHYLNNVLPKTLQSAESLVAHQSAISAYFSFLYELEIKDILTSTIYRKTRQLMAQDDDRPKKINYVSKAERSALLMACNCQRDRLIIRMGYEVGLRTEENQGLILVKHKAKSVVNKGLLDLFDELEQFPTKQCFEFVLNGKFTKGGKTRNIYFQRELLCAMKRYHDTERLMALQNSGHTCNALFIRMDKGSEGLPIGRSQGSNLFAKLSEKCSHINQTLSYHDLRHTFATELYHSELADPEGRETRSESAALIVASERLGHKNITSTTRYIRLRLQMLIIEEGKYE